MCQRNVFDEVLAVLNVRTSLILAYLGNRWKTAHTASQANRYELTVNKRLSVCFVYFRSFFQWYVDPDYSQWKSILFLVTKRWKGRQEDKKIMHIKKPEGKVLNWSEWIRTLWPINLSPFTKFSFSTRIQEPFTDFCFSLAVCFVGNFSPTSAHAFTVTV